MQEGRRRLQVRRNGFNEHNTGNMTSEWTKTQGKLRTYKHIERNQGKQKQVRSNQTQMGTRELMMTERGQEGPYRGKRERETQDMGIQV